jgi:hypothetical protein
MATDAKNQANYFVPFIDVPAPRDGEEGGGEEKITFNEKQQAKVNELIKEAQGRAAKETKAQLDEAKQKLNEFETQLNELKKGKAPKRGSEEEESVEDLKRKIDEMKSVHSNLTQDYERLKKQAQDKDSEVAKTRQELQDNQKRWSMQSAANRMNFVDVEEVVHFTDRYVKWNAERGRFMVVNEEGNERMNAAFEPMTLEEFYAEYAGKKPHLVRGDVKNGAGSSESQKSGFANGRYKAEDVFGPKSNARLANELYKSNPAEYKRLRLAAKEAGLIG